MLSIRLNENDLSRLREVTGLEFIIHQMQFELPSSLEERDVHSVIAKRVEHEAFELGTRPEVVAYEYQTQALDASRTSYTVSMLVAADIHDKQIQNKYKLLLEHDELSIVLPKGSVMRSPVFNESRRGQFYDMVRYVYNHGKDGVTLNDFTRRFYGKVTRDRIKLATAMIRQINSIWRREFIPYGINRVIFSEPRGRTSPYTGQEKIFVLRD